MLSDNSYTLYTWDYRYNDGDLRVRRTHSTAFDGGGEPTNGVAEHYVLDGDQVALKVEADGDVGRRYLWAGTDEVFNEAGTVGQAERGYWALTDHAGTVHELIESDADGTPRGIKGDKGDGSHFLPQKMTPVPFIGAQSWNPRSEHPATSILLFTARLAKWPKIASRNPQVNGYTLHHAAMRRRLFFGN